MRRRIPFRRNSSAPRPVGPASAPLAAPENRHDLARPRLVLPVGWPPRYRCCSRTGASGGRAQGLRRQLLRQHGERDRHRPLDGCRCHSGRRRPARHGVLSPMAQISTSAATALPWSAIDTSTIGCCARSRSAARRTGWNISRDGGRLFRRSLWRGPSCSAFDTASARQAASLPVAKPHTIALLPEATAPT